MENILAIVLQVEIRENFNFNFFRPLFKLSLSVKRMRCFSHFVLTHSLALFITHVHDMYNTYVFQSKQLPFNFLFYKKRYQLLIIS